MDGNLHGRMYLPAKSPTHVFILQASTELAATYAALILADDGIEITVSLFPRSSNPRKA